MFGKVRLAHRTSLPFGNKYAIKSLSRKEMIKEVDLDEELNILMKTDSPYIANFQETYFDHKYIHIVLEYCKDGNLYEEIIKRQTFTEEKTRCIIEQILRGINHLHSHEIIHRDLKPDNIMFQQDKIKIIDFGLSVVKQGEGKMNGFFGTPLYTAPEVFDHQHDKSCDIWSVGVITFLLLSGEIPFTGNSEEEIKSSIQSMDYEFPPGMDDQYEAKHFIRALMEKDVDIRLSAEAALKHPWICKKPQKSLEVICCKSHKEVSPEKITEKLGALKTFNPSSRLK